MPKRNLFTKAELMLREYAGMRKLHITQERWTILRYIAQYSGRFTANDVEGWVKNDFISRATVYNTLRLFEDAHIIQCLHVQYSGRLMEYEFAVGEQSSMQIICLKCGRTAKVTDKATQTAIRMKNYPNFIMQHYSVYVFGECKKCRKTINSTL